MATIGLHKVTGRGRESCEVEDKTFEIPWGNKEMRSLNSSLKTSLHKRSVAGLS